MKTTIRVATPEDAAAVHLLIRGLAEYEGEEGAVEVTPDVLRDQMAWRRPPFECLLAERDGRPVGLALFYPSYSTWRGRPGIHLGALFVVEEARHRGVGTASPTGARTTSASTLYRIADEALEKLAATEM